MLTELTISKAAAKEKPYRLADQQGLYLEIHPNGAKYWRYKYRLKVNGSRKEKRLALGVYPRVSLKEARIRHREAHTMVSEGGDPSLSRQQQRADEAFTAATFGSVGRDWFSTQAVGWSETHIKRTQRLFGVDLALLHNVPINQITVRELLTTLRVIEDRGAVETARRTNQVAGQIFRHGMVIGVCENNPALNVASALKKPQPTHYAAILDPEELGEILRVIDQYHGTPMVGLGLKLTPFLLVRPGELRHMEWNEVDLDQGEWIIPGSKMKSGRDHYVPLAHQVIRWLRELRSITGNNRYAMSSAVSDEKPLSNNTILNALRRIGISKEVATPHGFRATARTMLEERLGIRTDLIEHQLSHSVRDATGRAYNRTQFLTQRAEMMQTWADYLFQLKDGYAEVDEKVSIFRKEG